MAKPNKPKKECSRCKTRPAYDNNRYCSACSREIMYEMRHSGYLGDLPKQRYRPPGSMEQTQETKRGID